MDTVDSFRKKSGEKNQFFTENFRHFLEGFQEFQSVTWWCRISSINRYQQCSDVWTQNLTNKYLGATNDREPKKWIKMELK